MLVVERKIGQTLVLRPRRGRPHYRIEVRVQHGATGLSLSRSNCAVIVLDIPRQRQDVFLQTPSGEQIHVSLDRLGHEKAKVAINAPQSVLVLRGELEDGWSESN